MKALKLILPLLGVTLFIPNQTISAQHLPVSTIVTAITNISETNDLSNNFFVPVEEAVPEKKDKPSYVYRHHKRLPADYTGYVVEIISSKTPVQKSHPMFEQFGTVYYDKLEGQGFSYCIMTNFSSEESVQKYINTVIKRKAPEAKVITYKQGVRRTK